MNEKIYFSTDLVAPEFRTDAWRAIAKPLYEVSEFVGDQKIPLEGSIRSNIIGGMYLGAIRFNKQIYHRSRSTIIQSGLDDYLFQICLSGSVVADCDGIDLSAGVGDVCIIDLNRPLKTDAFSGATILAILSRAKVDRAVGSLMLHGTVLKAACPMTRLFADYMIGLSAMGQELNTQEAINLENAAISLLAACLTGKGLPQYPDNTMKTEISYVLRRRVLEFIEQNLTLPELGPVFLTRRFKVSRAHLYRMFMSDGGVAKIIREKRLDAAYLQLIHPSNVNKTVTEIAHQYCFSSNSHFLRAFRSYFDATPSDVKNRTPDLCASVNRIPDTHLRLFEHLKKRSALSEGDVPSELIME